VADGQITDGSMPKPRSSAAKRTRRRKGKIAAAARRRAVEATLADIAHEIRTPLSGILALGELLATSELGERERGWARAIKGTAEHLAMLTSLMVDAVCLDRKALVLRRELVHPRRLGEALAASLAARAQVKGLDHATHLADALPEALIGDPLRLRAALENLIDNAVKFTEHGSVRLELRGASAARGKVRLLFTVTDSGVGLSTAEVRRLFRPFAQANAGIARRYGGAGLGLAFVKRVAKAMGGDLALASLPGGGSRFQLSVVLDRMANAAAAGGRTAAESAVPLRPLNILCAEDNPYGRVVLNTILTELGHRADFVATGEAAIEAVARGRYDAVLIDVTLPGIDGVEATRRIRAFDSAAGRVPIVGISGRAKASNEALGRVAGMNGYLTKPLSPSALAQALAAVVTEPDKLRPMRAPRCARSQP
jgi:CheY-like chemotaxis protein